MVKIVVVDVDVKNGALGLESLENIEAEHGPLETLCATSPSGGVHLYFVAPDVPVSPYSMTWVEGSHFFTNYSR